MKTNQYWMELRNEDYDRFDHELRYRGIFPRAAHELTNTTVIVYFESTQEDWNDLLKEWADRFK